MQNLSSLETQVFFDTFLICAGLPPESRENLVKGASFACVHGTSWRLVATGKQENQVIRPELILPISVLKMHGQEVLNMLALQGHLLSEMNWWLSANEKGFLQLTSTAWSNEPNETLSILNVARLIAPQIMQYIVNGKSQ